MTGKKKITKNHRIPAPAGNLPAPAGKIAGNSKKHQKLVVFHICFLFVFDMRYSYEFVSFVHARYYNDSARIHSILARFYAIELSGRQFITRFIHRLQYSRSVHAKSHRILFNLRMNSFSKKLKIDPTQSIAKSYAQ